MRLLARAGSVLLTLALASPALAQDYSGSAGWYVGALRTSAMNSGAAAGSETITPDVGWTAGVFYEHWIGAGYLGYRLNGALGREGIPWDGDTRNVNSWAGDLSLVLRPLGAAPNRTVFPFFTLGAGAVVYDLGRGQPITFRAADALYGGRQDVRFAPVGGAGIDIVTPWSADFSAIVVRLEGTDQVVLEPPFERLSPGSDFSPVHRLRFSLSLHAGMGTLDAVRGRRP